MKRIPLAATVVLVTGLSFAQVNGPALPDGTEVDCDLPASRHKKNLGGSDGAGLCVFTSIGHAADWQNVHPLVDFRDYMTKFPGGGYPSKVTQYITKKCKELGVPEPDYVQIEGNQSSQLDILANAVQSGHMAGVTYGFSPTGRYGGQRISHMVNCVAARAGPKKLWSILDNNYPGSIEWMTEADFVKTYNSGGAGWSVILLKSPPPAPPRTRES